MADYKKSYSDKLKDPRWQKKRLEILDRDGWMCCHCCDNESTLHVHHLAYHGEPWEAPNDHLIALCEKCHEYETNYRKAAEHNLSLALRILKFDAGSVNHIASAFRVMDEFHVPDVMCSVLTWALTHESIMQELCDRYFKMLSDTAPQRYKTNGQD